MKKALMILALFLLFFIPQTVFAEEKVVTVNLYELDSLNGETVLPLEQAEAFEAAVYLGYIKNFVIEKDGRKKVTMYDAATGKVMMETTCTMQLTECDNEYLQLDEFTKDDSIEYETSLLSDAAHLVPELMEYDKVIINYSTVDSSTKQVYIESILEDEKSERTIINDMPKLNGLNIKLDLTFLNINDYIIYKIKVVNNTDKDYQIDNNPTYSNGGYIKYEYIVDDIVLKKHSSKEVYMKVSYVKEIPQNLLENGVFRNTSQGQIPLINEDNLLNNPNTKNNIMIIITILICIVLITIAIKKPSFRKKANLLIIVALLVPLSVYALETININIEADIEIDTYPRFCVEADGCYRFEDGMTWEEFLNSEYNVINLNYFERLNVLENNAQDWGGCGGYEISNHNVFYDEQNNIVQLSDEINVWGNYYFDWRYWYYYRSTDSYVDHGPGFGAC